MLPYEVLEVLRRPEPKRFTPPVLYNINNELVRIFYLQAVGSSHHPYMLCDGALPKRILWDRFNYGLDTHFYSADDVFHVRRGGIRHYARLAEAETIIPETWKRFRKEKAYIEQEFDAFFTHSAEMLSTFSNARFCPAGAVWYGTPQWGGSLDEDVVKTKMVSIVSSTKAQCPLHVFRLQLARHLIGRKDVDVLGTIVGQYTQPVDIFHDYRYSIAIENEVQPYWFTEKITNCFASKTVPIYYGATGIGEFFNTDGIIFISEPTIEAAEQALRQCSAADYEARREAIDDNFRRVKDMLCPEDFLCKHYPELLT